MISIFLDELKLKLNILIRNKKDWQHQLFIKQSKRIRYFKAYYLHKTDAFQSKIPIQFHFDINNNKFKTMSAIITNSITKKKHNFNTSIRKHQIQQFKKNTRNSLINHINPTAQIYRLKDQLLQYNVQYFQQEISQIIDVIKMYIEDQEFCVQLKSSLLIQNLVEVVIGGIVDKSYINAGILIEQLVSLIEQLLMIYHFFSSVVFNTFNLLVFAIYRYPLNSKIIRTITNFFVHAQNSFTSHYWKEQIINQKIVEESFIITRLFEIFLLRPSYQLQEGSGQFIEYISQGCSKWFNYASKILYISKTLISLSPKSDQILQTPLIKQSLHIGIQTFYKHLKNEEYQQQQTYCSQSESTLQSSMNNKQKNQLSLIYINLIFDLYGTRNDLLQNQEIELLKCLFKVVVDVLDSSPQLANVAVKILRILYLQVIFDDQDLENIAQHCPALAPSVQSIIYDFI